MLASLVLGRVRWVTSVLGQTASLQTVLSKQKTQTDTDEQVWVERWLSEKVITVHAWGPECGSLRSTRKTDRLDGSCNPSTWEAQSGDPQSKLVS